MSYIYNLTDTWGAAGTTFAGIKMAVTNTASSASSKLLDLSVSGATTASFAVDKSGNLALNGSITGPLSIGGTGTTSTLTLRSTSGVGASGADIIFQTGNNGATEAMRILNSGFVGIATPTPRFSLSIGATTSTSTATPNTIDLGGSYSNAAAANPKLRVWHDGTNSMGFGISLNQFEYLVPAGTSNVWYIGTTEVMRISTGGGLGINCVPTVYLDVDATTMRLRQARTPATGSAGAVGEICWDSGYVYVCVATNTWKRATLNAY